jgi:hypothetical protein
MEASSVPSQQPDPAAAVN